MQVAAARHEPLPPRRSRLQRSMDRLGQEMDRRAAGERAEIDELRVWLADRFLMGRERESVSPVWREVADVIAEESEEAARRELCGFFMAVFAVAGPEMLAMRHEGWRRYNLSVMQSMFRRRAGWRRAPGDWERQAFGDEHVVRASLARHLFVEWDMPVFMDQAWTHYSRKARMWRDLYVHMAAGRSLRTADLPYRMTRKQAHAFPRAPERSTIEQALVWADAIGLGADERLAGVLARTRLGWGMLLLESERREAWLGVVRYLVVHPEFALRHAGEVIDYLHARLQGGAYDALELRSRTPDRLMAEVRQWHRELAVAAISPDRARVSFPECEVSSLKEPADLFWERTEAGDVVEIAGISNALELREEGAAMSHCVFSYLRSCERGDCSVWSMRIARASGKVERLATIRVVRDRIVEAKGPANRALGRRAYDVLNFWAKREGLVARG